MPEKNAGQKKATKQTTMTAMGVASALSLRNGFIIRRQPILDSQTFTPGKNDYAGQRQQSQRRDDCPAPRRRGGVAHLHSMFAFGHDQPAQQIVGGQDLSR